MTTQLLIQKLSALVAALTILLHSLVSTPTRQIPPKARNSDKLGSSIPNVYANFNDSLASPMSTGDSSLTLVSGKDSQSRNLSGYVCLTINPNGANTEFVCGTAAGTSVTALERGLDVLTATTTVTALTVTHRRGEPVVNTDFTILGRIGRILAGIDTLPSIISYGTAPTFTAGLQIVDKTYVDGVAVAGAPNADTATKGIVQEATPTQAASSTVLGSTGARLYIPAGMGTSSPAVNAGLQAVITQNNGTINSNFIATTSSYQFTNATNTIVNLSMTNSTTTNATTTNLGVTSGNIAINGQNLRFPSGAGLSGQTLTNNGSNVLSWSSSATSSSYDTDNNPATGTTTITIPWSNFTGSGQSSFVPNSTTTAQMIQWSGSSIIGNTNDSFPNTQIDSFVNGYDAIGSLKTLAKFSATSSLSAFFGFGYVNHTATQFKNYGVFLQDNGTFTCQAGSGTASSTTAFTYAFDASKWHTYEIVKNSATSVTCLVDGNNAATVSTNVPTGAFSSSNAALSIDFQYKGGAKNIFMMPGFILKVNATGY